MEHGLVLVARLGGDELAILLPGHGRTGAERVLGTIIDGLRHPVRLDGRDHVVRASFGVVDGAPGDEPGDLMRRAANDSGVPCPVSRAPGNRKTSLYLFTVNTL
jgi:GGDEF domain-containing protein